ncbi:MAG: DUF2807 domain-containing protein [Bacteroidia bacterium]|nr:DUF2807 domain-containing protein [Bacteroidia bacterium]
MKKAITCLLLLVSTAIVAQNEVNGTFTSIEISGSAKVFIKQSEQSSVMITGNRQPDDVDIKDNTLHLSNLYAQPIYVQMPTLNKIEISGNGEITIDSAFTIDVLNIEVSGNGKNKLNINGGIVNIEASGNYNATLSGKADVLNAKISGKSSVDADNLVVKNSHIKISGLGKFSLDVRDSLETQISGKGTVAYKTTPAYLQTDNSGTARMGQGSDCGNDTTRINIGKTEVLIVDDGHISFDMDEPRKAQFHWAGFEMGLNNYLNADGKLEAPDGYSHLELRTGKAVFVNLNLAEYKIKLPDERFMIGTGFGFAFRNYYFANKDSILVSGVSPLTVEAATKTYDKYKLAVDYITVPLLFELNTNTVNKHSFHINAGLVFGCRIGSRVKVRSDDGKEKVYNDFNLNQFMVDTRVGIGFGSFNVFATYSLTDLFKENKGPQLTPVTVGITLLGF